MTRMSSTSNTGRGARPGGLRVNLTWGALVLVALAGCDRPSARPHPSEDVRASSTRDAVVGGTSQLAAPGDSGKMVAAGSTHGPKGTDMATKVTKTDAEWREQLTPEQYHVLREKGTERAFTGAYHATKEKGVYVCAACGNELFSSDTKFESGSGWPSFHTPVSEAKVHTETDSTHGMSRVEVTCARCGGHLGHVFDDGPEPTGLRYCINSASLELNPKK